VRALLSTVTGPWLGLGGTIAAALLAFIFGRINLTRANEHERAEALRQESIHTFATFCACVVEYRRSQLHRWFVGQDVGGDSRTVEERRPKVADDVRTSRAAAWSAFYRLLMICTGEDLTHQARKALQLTRSMKNAWTAEELNDKSDEVHAAVEEFARMARPTVRVGR
jgi:hypothetical protein